LVIDVRHNGLILNALGFSLFLKERFELSYVINPDLLDTIPCSGLLSYLLCSKLYY
jgi:hypothetical protein